MTEFYPDSFYCKRNEPQWEWFFCLGFTSITFFIFFFFYLFKIGRFQHQHPGYGFMDFSGRYVFSLTLLIHGILVGLEGFAYENQWNLGWSKFIISHFSQYMVAFALVYLMKAWINIFNFSSNTTSFNIASRVTVLSRVFLIFLVSLYIIVFILNLTLPPEISQYIILGTDVLRALGTIVCYFISMLWVSRVSGGCMCGLGSPNEYTTTLCSVVVGLLLFGLGTRAALLWYFSSGSATECSEGWLFLFLMLQALGFVLPLGFVAVVDTVLPEPPKQPQQSFVEATASMLDASTIASGYSYV